MTFKSTQITKGFALALAASTGMAAAGGLDRSGQSIDILFERGNVAELSFGYVTPSITGTFVGRPIPNMAPAYVVPGFGIKMAVSDQLSFALVYDKPFGSSVAYDAASPGFYGSGGISGITASVESNAVTALVRYDVSDRVMLFGGLAYQSISAEASIPIMGSYSLDLSVGDGFGYVAGAAYQIPEMALRVALTYRSEITSSHTAVETSLGPVGTSIMDITTPQSVNLEFQTGINPKTLIFGSIRWVNWSAFSVAPPVYTIVSGDDLLSYDNDVLTYSLGVGRKLTDTLSGAVTVGYERATGGTVSPLTPTDGNVSLGLGLTYDTGNGKITGGVRYVWVGDATDTFTGDWADNNAVAVGVSYSYDF